MCDLTDVSASNHDIKTRPDVLTISMTCYDRSGSCDLSSKVDMRQFRATGTERLKKGLNIETFNVFKHFF